MPSLNCTAMDENIRSFGLSCRLTVRRSSELQPRNSSLFHHYAALYGSPFSLPLSSHHFLSSPSFSSSTSPYRLKCMYASDCFPFPLH